MVTKAKSKKSSSAAVVTPYASEWPQLLAIAVLVLVAAFLTMPSSIWGELMRRPTTHRAATDACSGIPPPCSGNSRIVCEDAQWRCTMRAPLPDTRSAASVQRTSSSSVSSVAAECSGVKPRCPQGTNLVCRVGRWFCRR